MLVLARQTHHPHEKNENVSVHDFLKYVFSFPYQRIIETSKFGIIKIRKTWELSTTLRTWLCDVNSDKIFDILVFVSATELLFGSRDYQHIFFSLVFGNFQHLAVSFSVSFGMFWRDAARRRCPQYCVFEQIRELTSHIEVIGSGSSQDSSEYLHFSKHITSFAFTLSFHKGSPVSQWVSQSLGPDLFVPLYSRQECWAVTVAYATGFAAKNLPREHEQFRQLRRLRWPVSQDPHF